MRKIFVTGIGTNIGKTIVSAILTENLKADYWKPIQSGDLHYSDSMKVRELVANDKSIFHPEKYKLNQPLSPHASAKIDAVDIKVQDFELPKTENNMVIEGAGGLMVPINEHEFIIDLIQHLSAEVVLVSQNYLGSINHTILSYLELQRRNIKVIGIVFNGEKTPETEDFITNYTKLPVLFHLKQEAEITSKVVSKYSKGFTL